DHLSGGLPGQPAVRRREDGAQQDENRREETTRWRHHGVSLAQKHSHESTKTRRRPIGFSRQRRRTNSRARVFPRALIANDRAISRTSSHMLRRAMYRRSRRTDRLELPGPRIWASPVRPGGTRQRKS